MKRNAILFWQSYQRGNREIGLREAIDAQRAEWDVDKATATV
jgi:hypothetical protein